MVASNSKLQFSLEFEPAITDQFRTLEECVAAVVYGSRVGLSGVAAHCDLSPSAFGRMLSQRDAASPGGRKDRKARTLAMGLLPKIIEATNDYRPIHWLVAKHLPDDSMRQRALLARAEVLLPEMASVFAQLRKGSK
jgi:hypothetical protein